MNHTAQRLRITEPGMTTYDGPFGGVMFTQGLSDDIVDARTAFRLGSIVRVEQVDSGTQAGAAAELKRSHTDAAPVVEELPTGVPAEAAPAAPQRPRYTREDLEGVADKDGIAGLRAIAEPLGVRGRGIAELIGEILAAQ